MKTKSILGFFLSVFIMMAGCNKYDEGANFSLRSKQHRVEGEWDLTRYYVDGENQMAVTYTDYYQCNTGALIPYNTESKITRSVWVFDKNTWNSSETYKDKKLDAQSTYNSCYVVYNYVSTSYSQSGSWKFVSNKEKLELTFSSGNQPVVFEIIELREKKMQIHGYDAGDLIQLTFEKR